MCSKDLLLLESMGSGKCVNGGYQLTQALIAFGEASGLASDSVIASKNCIFCLKHTMILCWQSLERSWAVRCRFRDFHVCVSRLYGLQHWQAGAQSRRCFRLMLRLECRCYFGQALINIGVNIGLLPTKGFNTAFSELWGRESHCLLLYGSILLRIQYENDNSASLERQGFVEW